MSKRALVNAARVSLAMLFIAGLAMLALGVITVLRSDSPEVDGWLRVVFGRVFSVVAFGMAAALGIPSAVGVWAMLGATAEGAVPASQPTAQRTAATAAVVATGFTALVVLADGTISSLFNLVLIALVGMSTLGLAGAIAFSPHRGRAIAAAVTLALVVAAVLWVCYRAFLSPS